MTNLEESGCPADRLDASAVHFLMELFNLVPRPQLGLGPLKLTISLLFHCPESLLIRRTSYGVRTPTPT